MASLQAAKLTLINPKKTALFICDVQERFHYGRPRRTTEDKIAASKTFDIPTIVTEQYPKGLGPTVSELDITGCHKFEKKQFSMLIPPVVEMLQKWETENVILTGIEAHVCVEQTVKGLLSHGIGVSLLADGVSSQKSWERHLAFGRMKEAGAVLSSMENVLFQFLQSADSPHFKEIQTLLKVPSPPSGLQFGSL